jgi:hypothetical protein
MYSSFEEWGWISTRLLKCAADAIILESWLRRHKRGTSSLEDIQRAEKDRKREERESRSSSRKRSYG